MTSRRRLLGCTLTQEPAFHYLHQRKLYKTSSDAKRWLSMISSRDILACIKVRPLHARMHACSKNTVSSPNASSFVQIHRESQLESPVAGHPQPFLS